MSRRRALAWALLVAGILLAAYGLLRGDAAAACATGAEGLSAARCESAQYWLAVTLVGGLAAFVGLALLIAPRRRSRIV